MPILNAVGSRIYYNIRFNNIIFLFLYRMITTKLSLITVALLSSFLVTRGDQNNWKWQKPYAFESRPPKYLHSEVHNQPKPYSPIAETSPSAPFKPDRCELRKVVFTQDSRSPQVRKNLHWQLQNLNVQNRWIGGSNTFCLFYSILPTRPKYPTWRNSRCVIGTTFSTTRTISLFSRTRVSI